MIIQNKTVLDGALQDRVKHTSTEVRNGLLSSIATLRLTPSRRDIGARYSCVMTSEAIRNNRFVAKVVQLNLIGRPSILLTVCRNLSWNDVE